MTLHVLFCSVRRSLYVERKSTHTHTHTHTHRAAAATTKIGKKVNSGRIVKIIIISGFYT